MMPPGTRWLALARTVVDPVTFTRIIEPAIADLQHEWSMSAGAPPMIRLITRARAYTAVLIVIGLRVLGATGRASFAPPPWPLVRHVLRPTLVMIAMSTAFKGFLAPPHEAIEHWLLGVPDWILAQAVLLPFLWPALLQRRTLEWAHVPSPRARDIAKLTVICCALCLAWTGWLAPLLRQQYVIGIGQSASAAAKVHVWSLPNLFAALWADPASPQVATEIHQRLIVVALTPIGGVMAWIALRPRPGTLSESTFVAHLVRGIVLAVAGMAVAMAFEPFVGPIAAEWAGVLVAAAGALVILIACRLAERWPREATEGGK